jgi:TolB-like protein
MTAAEKSSSRRPSIRNAAPLLVRSGQPVSIPGPICHAHLERVSASFTFGRAGQLKQLLLWLGERALSPNPAAPSEKEIGVVALGRPDFDPQTDSIVRKEMGRLRDRLARYYSSEGAKDDLRICLTGGYLPTFERRKGFRPEGGRPCWLVLPFRSHSELGDESECLLDELLMELGSSGDLDLVAPTTALAYRGRSGDVRQFAAECHAHVVIEGSLRRRDRDMEGMAWMVDGENGTAQRHQRFSGLNAEAIAKKVAVWLLSDAGPPAQLPSSESTQK